MALVKSNGYSVYLGAKALTSLAGFLSKNKYDSYFILCDENTLTHCLPDLVTNCPELGKAEIIEIESGETSKSLNFSASILQTLLEHQADKQSLIINLGGGVVGDLGGFTASVYKRGIDFIQVPTSLLAMVDASIGGKTAVNFMRIKNVIGTFAQPKAVFIYPDFLKTLSIRHFQNGMAEVYKIALISDKTFWQELIQGQKAETLILKSVSLKNQIVLQDPFDNGKRNILNFGHTLGHAFEALLLGTKKEVLHGEAIVMGMVAESHLAWQKKLLSKAALQEVTSVLHSSFSLQSIKDLNFESILSRLKNDKKSLKNKFLFSLINKLGSCKIKVEVSETQIRKALEYYNSLVP